MPSAFSWVGMKPLETPSLQDVTPLIARAMVVSKPSDFSSQLIHFSIVKHRYELTSNSTPNLFSRSHPRIRRHLPRTASPRSSSCRKGLKPALVLFFVQGNGIYLTKFGNGTTEVAHQSRRPLAQRHRNGRQPELPSTVAGQDDPDQRSLRADRPR